MKPSDFFRLQDDPNWDLTGLDPWGATILTNGQLSRTSVSTDATIAALAALRDHE